MDKRPASSGAENHQQVNPILDRLLRREYAGVPADRAYGLYGRWSLYGDAEQPLDYYQLGFESLGLPATESIVDIGCSDGHNLVRLRAQHAGQLIGVDIDTQIFDSGKKVNAVIAQANQAVTDWRQQAKTRIDFDVRPLRNIEFVVGKVEQLPFADHSLGGALALFMLYHAADPERGLQEIRRVVKRLGSIAISTSAADNKQQQRELEQALANYLGAVPPPRFTAGFDTRIADDLIPRYLRVKKTIEQDTEVLVKPHGRDASPSLIHFLGSLHSMRIHFQPVPPLYKWQTAQKRVVWPYLQKSFDAHGHLPIRVHRKLYVCENSYVD